MGLICILIDGRFIQDHFPGIGRYTYNLVAALARVAPDDRFILLHNPALKNSRYGLAALARFPNLELRRVDAPTRSVREQFAIPRAVGDHEGRPYIFHSPYYIKPYFLVARSVVSIFDLIPLRVPNDLPNAFARLAFRAANWLAARTAARIIAPSAATRDDLIVILRVPRAKIAVVPLAADARFTPQPENEITRVREKYALPREYALSVGINKPHKNIATLVRAWRRVKSRAVLVIAGAWDERYAGKQEGGGAGEICFIHNIPDADLPALYAGARVFVMPSLYEGFGLPALEAMACGAPVIASNVSSLPEVVGDAALLFNPRDDAALAQLLARVLDDAALRDELRAKSRARARNFSWERTARETLAVYRKVISQQ